MTGPLPAELGQLAELIVLDLSYNPLDASLPPEWGQLAKLQELNLEGCRLVGELPAEWGELSQLERLHLQNNQFTGVVPLSWSGMERLITVPNQLIGYALNYFFVRDNSFDGCVSQRLKSQLKHDTGWRYFQGYPYCNIGSIPEQVGSNNTLGVGG